MEKPTAAMLAPPPAAITKTLWVRRSNQTPALYWWSLPLSLRTLASTFATEIASMQALVRPAAALGGVAGELGARDLGSGVARVGEVAALLQACDDGRVAPCRLALFPASRSDEDLQRAARTLEREFERQGFTMAIVPGGDGGMRHRFAFRVPGRVLEALEVLALGRRFGGNLGQVEMALLQGLRLRAGQSARLELVLQGGGVTLRGMERGGRRRLVYLESEKGFTGGSEELTLREAVGARVREAWRRFPVGVVMFAGLPFFIGAFWVQDAWARRARPASDESHRPQDERGRS